jgi:hypothetical protein
MADKTRISPAEAARQNALDNRGEISISPSDRRRIEEYRIARCELLERENESLRLRIEAQERRISDLSLRLRGVPR